MQIPPQCNKSMHQDYSKDYHRSKLNRSITTFVGISKSLHWLIGLVTKCDYIICIKEAIQHILDSITE